MKIVWKTAMSLLLIGCAVAVGAQGASAGKAAPKFAISSFTHDFGEVKPGTPLRYSFVFKNEGDAELRITNVAPSCGCTSSDYDKVVAPGKEGKITLAVEHTEAYSGEVSKSANVTTNDPAKPSFSLILRAYFKPVAPLNAAGTGAKVGNISGKNTGPLTISPSDRWTTSAISGTTAATKLHFYNREETPIKITKVEAGGTDFTVQLQPIVEGKRYELAVASNPALKPGQYKQTVKLSTDNPALPEVAVQLEVTVFARVFASPTTIMLPTMPKSADLSTTNLPPIYIRKIRDGGLMLKKVTSSLPFIKIEVKTETEGQFYILQLKFDQAQITKVGEFKGEIIVETNDAEVPMLKIPVSVSFN